MKDARHAFRIFAKSPGFTLVVFLTLAVGIGANTAMFGIVDGALLRPPPYKKASELINILDTSIHEKELAKIFSSYADFEEYSRHSRTLARLGAATWAGRPNAVLTGRGPAKSYLTIPVTSGFFGTLGVSAEKGRTFTDDDLRGGCAVVLSDHFWRGPLAADPTIVGSSLSLDDRACTVIGVMPSEFAFYPPETEIWTLLLPDDPRLKKYFGVFIVARLKPGATVAQAQTELTALHTAMHSSDSNGEQTFVPLLGSLQDQFTWLAGRNLKITLGVLFASVVALLAIACLNVGSLFIGRTLARTREFAIRAALGSGARRVVLQLFTEAALLTSAGAAAGLFVAYGAIRYFLHAQSIELPPGAKISINATALLFTLGVSTLTAIFFAIVPARTLFRADLFSGLRNTGRTAEADRQTISRILIAAQVALAVTLLAGAGLLTRSILKFEAAPVGFAVDDVMVAGSSLPRRIGQDVQKKGAFYDELQQKVASLSGVAYCALASTAPPFELGLGTVEIQGRPVPRDQQRHDVGDASVSPDYFRVLNIPLRSGRSFSRQDQPQSEAVAVVNEAFAREYFADRNPIGQQVRLGEAKEWLTVVGVAGDELRPQVFEEMSWIAHPIVYRAIDQFPSEYFSMLLRTRSQQGLGHAIEGTVASIDPDAGTGDLKTMRARLAPNLKYPQFRATVLGIFSTLALLLAAVGLYGVLAQFVAQRTCEIGVRMAVGANHRDIVKWIVRAGGLPVLMGLTAGLCATIPLTRFISSLLYGITPNDPLTFVAASAIILCAAAAAVLIPSLRALRVDPLVALRSE